MYMLIKRTKKIRIKITYGPVESQLERIAARSTMTQRVIHAQ